ncbi:MAG TPA: ABC transporter ATP-binding protein, partial [Acholeplasmataceae bacterium]|nr:ABC transporter ATP-binding protein [Acholeplasmataceae bacterium]
LILEHKKLGATIFLSSHIFEEVEKTCDRVMIIKNGHIVEDNIVEEIKAQFGKEYIIEFKTNKDAKAFINQYGGKSYSHKKVSFLVETNVNDLIQYLTQYDVIDVSRKDQSIEEIFLKYYGDNND